MFRETGPRFYFNNRPLLGVYPPLNTRASTPMPPPPGPLPFPPPCPLPVPPPCPLPVPPPWTLPFPPPGPLPFPPPGLLLFPPTAPLPFPPPNGQFQVPPPPQQPPTLQRQKRRRNLRTVERTERRSLPNRARIVGKTENSSAPRGGSNPAANRSGRRSPSNQARVVSQADRRSDLCQVKKESSSDDQKVVFVRESEPHQDAENADPKTMNNNKARGKQAPFRLLYPRFRSSAPIYAHLMDARLRSSGPTDLTNGHEDNARLEKPIMQPGLE